MHGDNVAWHTSSIAICVEPEETVLNLHFGNYISMRCCSCSFKYHHVVDQKCIYNREGSVEAGDEDTTTNHYRAYYCASEQLWRVFSWMQLVIIVIVISLVLARFILEAGKTIATIKTPPEDAEKTLTPAPPSAV